MFCTTSVLVDDLTAHQVRLHRKSITQLERGFHRWRKMRSRNADTANSFGSESLRAWRSRLSWRAAQPQEKTTRHLCYYLGNQIERQLEKINSIETAVTDFQRLYPQAPSEYEQRELILTLAYDLGASKKSLRQDTQALNRWLDHDAIVERANRMLAESQQQLAFLISRLGRSTADVLASCDRELQYELWQQLQIESTCRSITSRRIDDRVVSSALDCLKNCLKCLNAEVARTVLTGDTLTFVQLAARSRRSGTWVQCAALGVLQIAAPHDFEQAVRNRFQTANDADCRSDDIFVRYFVTQLLAQPSDEDRINVDLLLLGQALEDCSPYVRQGAIRAVVKCDAHSAIAAVQGCLCHDNSPKVRAAALILAYESRSRLNHQQVLKVVVECLRTETDPFVLRTAIHVVGLYAMDIVNAQNSEADSGQPSLVKYLQRDVFTALGDLECLSDSIPVRRYAAHARERIWLASNRMACKLALEITHLCGDLTPGRSRYVPRSVLHDLSETTVGRVLAVLSQEDFGFDIQRTIFGYRITRGPVIRFRLWRFLYELRNASPDKRQAFRHTVGRVSHAHLRAPSAVLAEVSETKVPGEPLYQATEDGWRPFLPLVDDVLSTLNQFGIVRPTRFYTSQGVTVVTPPKNMFARCAAYIALTTKFTEYAKRRNWTADGNFAPHEYVSALKQLGISITFESFDEVSSDSASPAEELKDNSVRRFFPALVAVSAPTWVLWCKRQASEYISYFTSIYDNSLEQLVAFATVFTLFFIGRHVYLNLMLRKARTNIPVAIGGWGTRGKSGTERLKSALFNGMGHSVLSKSTGCEAMFLYAPTYGNLREFPLYRPEEKATIWEHRDTLLMTAKLGASLFIWECMALRAEFVRVLQRQWTRDDLSTITNAIPDHEDVQGPAGFNVAETIATFIPNKSKLLTTERQMRPILSSTARQLTTEIQSAGWLESGLLTDDVLSRFPYEEHPDNVALTLLLAKEIGCDPNFALKEMADRLVPDLGVLKVSPPANVKTRTLEFANGMSANERHGCLGNWTRLGFDKQDYVAEPGVWISTVVNNRSDRVSRSRVFANILVQDLSVDRHFLIGSNLNGMHAFIREAWQNHFGPLRLWCDAETTPQAIRRLEELAKRFRQCTSYEQIERVAMLTIRAAIREYTEDAHDESWMRRLASCCMDVDRIANELTLRGVSPDCTSAITRHLKNTVAGYQEYRQLHDRICGATNADRVEIECETRSVLWQWFQRKLITIEDSRASGEMIIQQIAQETPPGFRNRIMGLQNIKATGLDFAYRWQAWAECHKACEMVRSDDLATAQKGLQRLSAFEDFGILCRELTESTVTYAEHSGLARREQTRLELERIRYNVQKAMELTKSCGVKHGKSYMRWFTTLLDDFLSVTDSIKRRRMADQIYADLVAERISHGRAILELRTLCKRQQNGWISQYIDENSALKKSRRPGRRFGNVQLVELELTDVSAPSVDAGSHATVDSSDRIAAESDSDALSLR